MSLCHPFSNRFACAFFFPSFFVFYVLATPDSHIGCTREVGGGKGRYRMQTAYAHAPAHFQPVCVWSQDLL
uniref:Putative secreted protein n=1 Tax=Anopheles darlingi TaxID=43151 RepID=A0A2M4DFZ9_ANODA